MAVRPLEKNADITVMEKIGFGGSCHWCTEAIFQSLKGVVNVWQGWIASEGDAESFSEAVIVDFDTEIISQTTLISIHLHTHSCTSNHTMRTKYRSAIYVLSYAQASAARQSIEESQPEFKQPVITTVLHLHKFELNKPEYLNYYYSDPGKLFCQNIVAPKLKLLMEHFSKNVKAIPSLGEPNGIDVS